MAQTRTASAPGKIILSGDYAVVFGEPGIAVPAKERVEVTWEDTGTAPMEIVMEGLAGEQPYARAIVDLCSGNGGPAMGRLTIRNAIPVGRGIGSSTALVIAICRCLLGNDNKPQAMLIEDAVNPGNSGLDFATIWAGGPVVFTKGSPPEPVRLPLGFLETSELIDTGKPNETTAELVGWMRSRSNEPEIAAALKTIGRCTERLLDGEDPKTVIRDHHRAQVALGVVPKKTQLIIAEIELTGGAAKVLGAGARTGGGGMVLLLQ